MIYAFHGGKAAIKLPPPPPRHVVGIAGLLNGNRETINQAK